MPVNPTKYSVPVKDLEARFERLAQLAEEIQGADGSLDLVTLAQKVAALGDQALNDALVSLRVDTFGKREEPTKKISGADAEGFLATVRATSREVRRMDTNRDGKVDWDEGIAFRSHQTAARGVSVYLESGNKAHNTPSKELVLLVDKARTQVRAREQLDYAITHTTNRHAESKLAREAIIWTMRAQVLEGINANAVNLDRRLGDAETTKRGFFEKIGDFFSGNEGPHLNDAEVRTFLGADDLATHVEQMKARVEGRWSDYVAGTDIPHADLIDEVAPPPRPRQYGDS